MYSCWYTDVYGMTIVYCYRQNAELKFNFGATPFECPPVGGYSALVKASKDNLTISPLMSTVSSCFFSAERVLIYDSGVRRLVHSHSVT